MWGDLDQSGYPATTLTQVPAGGGTGLNAALVVSSNASGPRTNFSYQSNFYTRVGSAHTHSGFTSDETSEFPYAFDPIDDLDGSRYNTNELRTGVPAYTFTCLDEADDVKYAIFIFIREWNTVSDFFSYGESKGATYNPDVTGREGAVCSGIGSVCNDLL